MVSYLTMIIYKKRAQHFTIVIDCGPAYYAVGCIAYGYHSIVPAYGHGGSVECARFWDYCAGEGAAGFRHIGVCYIVSVAVVGGVCSSCGVACTTSR